MALVTICGNLSANPDAVGVLRFEQSFDREAKTRTSRTTGWDMTGQHVMFEVETVCSTDYSNKEVQTAIQIDNVVHDEVRLALHERRAAKTYAEIRAAIEKGGIKTGAA